MLLFAFNGVGDQGADVSWGISPGGRDSLGTQQAGKDSLEEGKKEILQMVEMKAENTITGYISLCDSVSATVREQTQLLS